MNVSVPKTRTQRIVDMGDLGSPEIKQKSMMDSILDYISYPFTSDRSDDQKKDIIEKHNEEIKELLDKINTDENNNTYISKTKIFVASSLAIGLPILAYKLMKKRKSRRSLTKSRTKTRKTL